MTDLEKRAEKYCCYNFPTTHTENMVKACVEFAQSESALLSQHILDLQKDKGNLTDRVRELEQQIEKMKCCGNCENECEDYCGNSCCKKNKYAWNCNSWEIRK
jgi:hypothetical protein